MCSAATTVCTVAWAPSSAKALAAGAYNRRVSHAEQSLNYSEHRLPYPLYTVSPAAKMTVVNFRPGLTQNGSTPTWPA
jgi:hypothetical protein